MIITILSISEFTVKDSKFISAYIKAMSEVENIRNPNISEIK
jgi:hypothetical protein